ncbi:hypothetical protein EAG_06033 [Camponotus floridanus]|uniref:Uncharacterized protein n=1 Tax=Camponotus floridanus TaxID=104421 RepID=E2B065_CAMFO|nr:hypothetical protein EAG_06033 [Camponotus floridanus]
MSLRMIHRFALSNCRNRFNIEAYWGIVPSLRVLQKKPVLQKNKLKENETDIGNISALQIKKRPTRRNKVVISEDKAAKPDSWNVKALATAEEYNLEALAYGLLDQQLYIPSKISTSTNCKYS